MRLQRWRDKLQLIRKLGVDRVFVLRFNQSFAQTSAEDFIQRYLIQGIGVSYVVVGDDFRFGKDRRGDFPMLQDYGRQHGFEVVHMDTHRVDRQRVSSSRIRRALAAGDLHLAQRLLGPFLPAIRPCRTR